MLTALSAGVALPDFSAEVTEDNARAAFDELADPRRRIVHELFWLWGPDTEACGCPGEVHDTHDQAVRAHADALDAELTDEDEDLADALWLAAAHLWTRLLRRDGLWRHVQHRVRALEDPRLDEATVAVLRDELPRSLVASAVALAVEADQPGRLIAHARRFRLGGPLADQLLAEAAQGRLPGVEERLDRARDRLDGGDVDTADSELRAALPVLRKLKVLAPEHRPVSRIRDQAAVLAHNLAFAMAHDGSIAPRFWLDVSLELVADSKLRADIASSGANLDAASKAVRRTSDFPIPVDESRDLIRRAPLGCSFTRSSIWSVEFGSWYGTSIHGSPGGR